MHLRIQLRWVQGMDISHQPEQKRMAAYPAALKNSQNLQDLIEEGLRTA